MLWSFLPLCDDATWARYWMTFLVFSVFPAPDSPLQKKITIKSKHQNIIKQQLLKKTLPPKKQIGYIFMHICMINAFHELSKASRYILHLLALPFVFPAAVPFSNAGALHNGLLNKHWKSYLIVLECIKWCFNYLTL